MAESSRLKTSFRASPRSLQPVYTTGPVQITRDGKYIITCLGDEGEEALISEVDGGLAVARIKGDGTPITALAVSYHTSPPTLLTAHQSLSIRYYPLPDPSSLPTTLSSTSAGRVPYLKYSRQLTKAQTHQSPIISLSISPPIPSTTSPAAQGFAAARAGSISNSSGYEYDAQGNVVEKCLFASGSADGVVKVWDLKGGFVTHVFRGHGGGVSALSWRFLDPLASAYGEESSASKAKGYMNPQIQELVGSKGKGKGKDTGDDGGRVMQLITGSVDSKIRIFDLLDPAHRTSAGGGRAKYTLEGHVSVVRAIAISGYIPGCAEGELEDDEPGRWMMSAGRDRVILLWDFGRRGEDDGSYQPLSGISAPVIKKKKSVGKGADEAPRVVQTSLTSETIEAMGLVRLEADMVDEEGNTLAARGRLVVYTGGEKGIVKLWDVKKAVEVGRMDSYADEEEDEADDDEEDEHGLRDVLYNVATQTLVSVHHDQNIILHSARDSSISRQIIGFNDEIIDSVYLSPDGPDQPDTHIALATNSSLIRIYDAQTLDARLISGHSDVVLCLDVSKDGRWLVSGSKDNTARIWARDDEGDWVCVALAEGHAESIGAVAMSRKESFSGYGRFLFTASQDKTVKMWDLSVVPTELPEDWEPVKLKSLATMKIHEKDINGLDVAPNDGFLVSGSQDKTIKVFSISYTDGKKPSSGKGGLSGTSGGIKVLGTCKGHKRGVWSVKFSPADRVIASSGGDRVVRVWSMDDFTCLKTLEGHTNSVLKVDFLSKGQQLVSSGSDGLVKLWNVKEEECIKTLDGHVDKVWTLAVARDEKTILSGGADSVLNIWEDCTEELEKEELVKRQEEVEVEQNYNTYMALNDYKRAIQLALAMSQPGRLRALFEKVHTLRPRPHSRTGGKTSADLEREADLASSTGSAAVDEVLNKLSARDLVRLLKFVRDWNSRNITAGLAQRVLGAILRGRKGEDIREAFESARRRVKAAAAEDEEEEEDGGDMDVDKDDQAEKRKAKRKEEELISLQQWLESIIPYTERHLQRVERMLVDSYMVDYILGEMDGGMLDGIDEYTNGYAGEEEDDPMADLLSKALGDLEDVNGDDAESMEVE